MCSRNIARLPTANRRADCHEVQDNVELLRKNSFMTVSQMWKWLEGECFGS